MLNTLNQDNSLLKSQLEFLENNNSESKNSNKLKE